MASLPVPRYVTLRWVPGTSSLVQFIQAGRTFVVSLPDILFTHPHGFAPLYLLGSVRVPVTDITLSAPEQAAFDALSSAAPHASLSPDDIRAGRALSAALHA